MQLTDLAHPAEWRAGAAAVAAALKANDRFLVCAHARLDGDALASMAAAGFLLRALGKEFVLYAPFGVPAHLAFLELPGHVETTLGHLPFVPEALLALDCGEAQRLGDALAEELDRRPGAGIINVDHHRGPGMGTIATLVLPEAAATAQILASIVAACGMEPDGRLARALLLGLVTDTGCFRHSNTDARVLALASWLSLRGASLFEIREHLDKVWTLERFRLWGRLSGRIELMEGGRLAFCQLSLEDLQATGTGQDDTEGFCESLRNITSVDVAALLRETAPGVCRVSLRSSESADVRAMAAGLGGGGHLRAAGGTLKMPLAEARRAVLAAIREGLAARKGA